MKQSNATTTQTDLTATGRMNNVSSAFEVVQRNSLEGKLVLLVVGVNAKGATVCVREVLQRDCGHLCRECGTWLRRMKNGSIR